jgi:hypothetical protein
VLLGCLTASPVSSPRRADQGEAAQVLEYLRSVRAGRRVVNLATWLSAASVCDTEAMKPLRCLLHLHVWHNYYNDEGQRYQLCTRCGAYREIYILTDYRAGSA